MFLKTKDKDQMFSQTKDKNWKNDLAFLVG